MLQLAIKVLDTLTTAKIEVELRLQSTLYLFVYCVVISLNKANAKQNGGAHTRIHTVILDSLRVKLIPYCYWLVRLFVG